MKMLADINAFLEFRVFNHLQYVADHNTATIKIYT